MSGHPLVIRWVKGNRAFSVLLQKIYMGLRGIENRQGIWNGLAQPNHPKAARAFFKRACQAIFRYTSTYQKIFRLGVEYVWRGNANRIERLHKIEKEKT
jgi:hypothetical protein